MKKKKLSVNDRKYYKNKKQKKKSNLEKSSPWAIIQIILHSFNERNIIMKNAQRSLECNQIIKNCLSWRHLVMKRISLFNISLQTKNELRENLNEKDYDTNRHFTKYANEIHHILLKIQTIKSIWSFSESKSDYGKLVQFR